MSQLKLGLPKGSLEKATIELFESAGWLIKPAARNYFPEIDDPELDCSICRPQEMSRYVEDGVLDAGITGKDWIMENGSDTILVCDLVYSKVSRRPTRWIVAVAGDSDIQSIQDLQGKKVSTELVNVTRRFFAKKGIDVDIEFSWGATEAKAVSGLADAIVEVTETESTIRAHGLRIIHELMQSNTQFIASREAWNDPWKREKIENIALLLQGSLNADRIVGLKMNVANEKLEEIVAILPSINAPTVAHLHNQEWCSVETVVSEEVVRDLIPRLKRNGAEGIIEYALNKVI
ncbi:MAG: ATP phosphoribosyltransferase [Deltaproteobacteria bacterium]|nr:ATP phosphoribosyltransferase [Deltaproteobacteria bacterium]MBW2658948.1 ATP phosphoribosyltransferase [Deltaproteobacteria bacterium]